MTDKLYTQSDLESLRERCAKVADSRSGTLPDDYERHPGCYNAWNHSASSIAIEIRALPITPHDKVGQ